MRDKFREMGEVKHAEMRNADTGMVRFADEKSAELAISKDDAIVVHYYKRIVLIVLIIFIAEIMDGARFDNQTVYVSFF